MELPSTTANYDQLRPIHMAGIEHHMLSNQRRGCAIPQVLTLDITLVFKDFPIRSMAFSISQEIGFGATALP
jgi:hypothetical protein